MGWGVVGRGAAEKIFWSQTNLALSAGVSHFFPRNLSFLSLGWG